MNGASALEKKKNSVKYFLHFKATNTGFYIDKKNSIENFVMKKKSEFTVFTFIFHLQFYFLLLLLLLSHFDRNQNNVEINRKQFHYLFPRQFYR